MIEAVGREYWPIYFGALDRLLVPGGRIGLQAITMPHVDLVSLPVAGLDADHIRTLAASLARAAGKP